MSHTWNSQYPFETALVDEVGVGPVQGPNAVLPESEVPLGGYPMTEVNHLKSQY